MTLAEFIFLSNTIVALVLAIVWRNDTITSILVKTLFMMAVVANGLEFLGCFGIIMEL